MKTLKILKRIAMLILMPVVLICGAVVLLWAVLADKLEEPLYYEEE